MHIATLSRIARRTAAALCLTATALLTACGGGSEDTQDAAQIQRPEITRYHKLSQGSATANGSVQLQLQVQSVGLIDHVTLVSPAADGAQQSSQALAFRADGKSLTVELPAASAQGGWMLVVTDDAGVSSAAMVVDVAAPASPAALGQ